MRGKIIVIERQEEKSLLRSCVKERFKYYVVGKVGMVGSHGRVREMPLTKIDDKGRIVLPNDLRRKIGLKQGDELLIDEIGEGTFILKKVDVRAMLRDAIAKAKSIDNEKLEREIEEESNQFARSKFKIPNR